MRALSLTQPWATLLASGAKRVETRSWSTVYRGLLAIHAAKGFPRDCRDLCLEEPFRSALGMTAAVLPLGAIVAVARLREVWSTDSLTFIPALRPRGWDEVLTPRERDFGDYAPGRFAWVFVDIVPLKKPIACKGALGLWDVPAEVAHVLQMKEQHA